MGERRSQKVAAFFVQNSKTAQYMGYRTTRPATIYSYTAAVRTHLAAESGQKGRKEVQKGNLPLRIRLLCDKISKI